MNKKVDLGKISITLHNLEWNSTTVFEELTITPYEGESYISLTATQGNNPKTSPNFWMKVSARGESIYDLMVRTGKFDGTLEEFIQEYDDAVKNAETATSEVRALESEVRTSENTRQENEEERSQLMSTWGTEWALKVLDIEDYLETAYTKDQVDDLLDTKQDTLTFDTTPTEGSVNPVQSGGVQNELALGAVYDVSAKNPTAGPNNDGKWESLSALLSDASLNTLIPTAYRKGGMSVKFVQSSDNKYTQYRLLSPTWSTDILDWFSEDSHIDMTNAPDEEDLTSVNVKGINVLKFKNKAYTPLTYSGMGRVYLRKNIVNGVNTLNQDMFYKGEVGSRVPNTNTIFVIQYNYDLNDTNAENPITIPENCILEFEGGSFNNGFISLNNTILKGDVAFFNVVISGSCANEVLTPQMFGAKPSIEENESNKTQHTLAFKNLARVIDDSGTISKSIYIPSGHYSINEKIVIISGCKIYGDGENSIIDCYEGIGGIYIGYDSVYAEKCERLDCTLAEEASKGATSITLNDVSDIHEDDYLILYDIVDGSFSKSRTYYRMSELIKVRKIEGNTLYLHGALYGDYSTTFGEEDTTSISDAPDYRIVISKFFPQQYLISDISIFSHEHQNSSPETYYTFSVVGHCDSLFKNIHIENRGNKVSAQIGLGINFKVEHCIIRNYARYTGDSYGLNINLSQNFSVSHCTLYANSHVLATGGNSNYYGINNRNFVYDSLYLEESSDGQIQLDAHANSEYYTLSNIVAPHAKCDTGGINVTIFNCVFYYITATFNMSGFVIRNCEMFAGSSVYLVPSRNLNVPPELRDIVMENNLIHGYNTIDLQNATGLNIPMNKFIFKNNVCKGLRLKSGKIKTAIIEGNIFADRELRFEVDSDNLQVFNNLFENGYMSILDSNEVHGQISGNKIHYNGEDTSRYVVYLNHFFGLFNNNLISSSVVLGALLLSYGNTRVSIYDNIFKLGTRIGAYRIIQATRGTIVTANRNIHNSMYPSIITVDDLTSGATTDKYNYVGPTSRFSDTNNIDAIGSTLYVRDSNKLGYFSNGINSDRLLYLSAVADKPSVVSNPFEKDNLYYVTFSKYSKNNIVCFSKTEEIVEKELLRAVLERNSTNQVFKAPDPEEYPYVYVATENTSKVDFSFYKNRNASEFDGAAFNVKRKGTSNERPVGNDIYVNFLYFDTDLNKMIYAKAISGNEVTWEVVGSRIETYNYIEKTSDTAFTDVKIIDRIGNPIFVRNQNKLGYISNGKKGNALLSISALADNPTIAQNIFEKDKLYFVAFGRSESFNDVYFSKTLEIVEEELLRVAHERYTENQVFKAPDPVEYPYIYVSTLNRSVVWFKFYENRNASEYDGAAFNVKRKGTTAERPIGYDIYEGFVYFDTDLGKQIYAKSINESDVTWEFAGSKLETYNYVAKTATTTFDNVGTVERIGNPIFVRNQNKLGYISNGKNGAALISVSAKANAPAITQNTLEKGKLYFVAFSRSESLNEVYFSKTEEIVEGELLRVARERYTENQVFEAPDPVEYPYIYVKTLNNSIVWFRFYLNRNASEYDGAAFNVNRKGTSTDRPYGYDIYEGFVYFDTTLGKPIWAKTINSTGDVVWVDATGATV